MPIRKAAERELERLVRMLAAEGEEIALDDIPHHGERAVGKAFALAVVNGRPAAFRPKSLNDLGAHLAFVLQRAASRYETKAEAARAFGVALTLVHSLQRNNLDRWRLKLMLRVAVRIGVLTSVELQLPASA
jgi:hypothetical protein